MKYGTRAARIIIALGVVIAAALGTGYIDTPTQVTVYVRPR